MRCRANPEPVARGSAGVAGRVDVLVYRIAERLAARHCPREWPALEPLVRLAAAEAHRSAVRAVQALARRCGVNVH